MNVNNFVFFDDFLTSNEKIEPDLPLLDSSILNEINEQNLFEIENFFTPVPSNENENLSSPDFISTSQNCSFDSISIDNQYNSSSSGTSEIYSPIQITPPETPPSSETTSIQSISPLNNSLNKIRKSSSKKTKNEQDSSKKKKLLPLAPKTDAVTFVQINNSNKTTHLNRPNKFTANDLLNNSNLINLNDQNVYSFNSTKAPSNNFEQKLSKEELSKIKEKARRLRNRQSAMNSRQKKIEHVKNIEKKLEELTDENQNLKKENSILKDLVNKLTFENVQLKNLQNKMQNLANNYPSIGNSQSSMKKCSSFLEFNSNGTNKTKKTVSLLAVIFLIGLNMNMYNDNFKTYDLSKTKRLSIANKGDENLFKGRVLLWHDNLEQSYNNSNNTINIINCNQNLISQNETLILESKLRNWAIHQTTKQTIKQHLYSSANKLNFANFYKTKLDDGLPNDRKSWYLGIRNWNNVDETRQQQRKKRFYSIEDEFLQLNYEQIINSVKPKDDTYYFLSLNTADHLILPLNFYSNTSSKNGLLRPKFSLLLPIQHNSQFLANFTNSRNATKEFNSKSSNSFLQFIEIDFEVINMKPIQILKSRFANRFRRLVRNSVNNGSISNTNSNNDKAPTINSTSAKALKSILLRNQTNVQIHFNKTSATLSNET